MCKAVVWKAHDGPITFIKKFPHINDDHSIIATGSHDKSLKFWSVPFEWLEFKKQAKAKLANTKTDNETIDLTAVTKLQSERSQPEPEKQKPAPLVQAPAPVVPDQPKPKKKKAEQPKAEPEPQKKEEVVHDLDAEEKPKKAKKQSEKANLFDSDGDEDKEFS